VNTNRKLTLLDTTTTAGPTGWRRWIAAFARTVTVAVDRGLAWLRENWPLLAAAAVVVAAAALVAGVLRLAWLLLTAIGDALGAASDGLTSAGRWLGDGPITRTIADPVRAWLDGHSAGLPATGGQLALLWAVVAAVLYLQALLGSRYARIGWAVVGAATTAAAYTGSHPAGAAGAAGVTAAVWLLLSLPAYAGSKPGALTRALAQFVDDYHRRRLDAANRRTGAGRAAADTTV
jgi:hypothetical protein